MSLNVVGQIRVLEIEMVKKCCRICLQVTGIQQWITKATLANPAMPI